MNLHRQVTTTAILLMLFAAAGAGLVGLTHDNTAEIIRHNEQLTLLRKLNTLVPAEKYDNDLLHDTISIPADDLLGTNQASIVYRARKQDQAVAVVLSPVAPGGYNGSIELLVGIYADGSLAGVRVVKHRETPGLGDAVEASRSDWILGFSGKSLGNPAEKRWKVKRDGGDFDQFTGATITPRAVVKAVHGALVYFAKHQKTLFSEIKPAEIKPAGKTTSTPETTGTRQDGR
jgi:electron transport complex protein RnfG